MFYFKENMQKFIVRSKYESVRVPIKNGNSVLPEDKEDSFVESIPVKRYYLSGKFEKVYLTQQEKNCIHWCVKGKSSEEIAMLLGIGKKTVENRIYKIKEKLNCYKQSQLITIAIEQGIVSCK